MPGHKWKKIPSLKSDDTVNPEVQYFLYCRITLRWLQNPTALAKNTGFGAHNRKGGLMVWAKCFRMHSSLYFIATLKRQRKGNAFGF
jgi:hypothetical protein